MEKTASVEERIRRAEEIYQRRRSQGVRVYSNSASAMRNSPSISLFKKMIIKIISWIIFIGLVIALIVGAINIYMVTTTSKRIISVDDAKDINADCIIVLGAGVKPSGKPSWMLEDRIIVGEQLYNVNAAPKLLMSGDHGRENYDEVNTMKNYAINDGIPS